MIFLYQFAFKLKKPIKST